MPTTLVPGSEFQINVNSARHVQSIFQGELADGVTMVSRLLGPRQNGVGHGAYVYENHLGGRVAVVMARVPPRVAAVPAG